MQVLQRRPVLRQRFLLPYVPLLGAGSASVPAMKILNGEVFSVVIRDLQKQKGTMMEETLSIVVSFWYA